MFPSLRGRIWTCDLSVPNTQLYQTELLPDIFLKGFEPLFPPWKGSVLTIRRQEHILPEGNDPNGIWTRDTTVTGLRDNHFTIGSRWEKRELHPQRFLCNAFTERRHTYLIVAFLPYGSGGTWTHNFQVKSPLLYQLSYRPEGLNFQGAVSQPLV